MAPLHAAAESEAPSGRYAPGTALAVGELSCVVKHFLGSGGHANVYLVALMHDGATRVLKHIPLDDEPERRRLAALEIGNTRSLQGHANIVALEAAEITDEGAFILMEQCAGDVLSLMSASADGMLDEPTVLHIFCDVCKAVAHMHYQPEPLLHRDLKVENILFAAAAADAAPVYKLCDFGSATATTIAPGVRLTREQIAALEDELQRTTTLEYRAPEMVDLYLQRGITERSDIWALGVLLYKLCYFRTPFDNMPSLAILNAEYSVPATPAYSQQLRNIFQMTLREEPRERPTIFTLCAYVCALRGEPCLLENKYATPPLSPVSERMDALSRRTQRDGLGCVSARPVHQPRLFAATPAAASRSSTEPNSSPHTPSTSRPSSGTPSEQDTDRFVPMRRGRPAKALNAPPQKSTTQGLRELLKPGGASSPVGGRLKIPGNRASLQPAPATPQGARPTPAPFSRTGSSANARPALRPTRANCTTTAAGGPQIRSHTGDGAVVATQHRRQSSEGAGACPAASPDPDADSGSDVSCADSSSAQRLRMSVRAPDGRESMSIDFVQGAVFGSARRTSVMRRDPSVTSMRSRSSRVSVRSALQDTPGDAASNNNNNNRCSSGTDVSDSLPLATIAPPADSVAQPPTPESTAAPGLPEFVNQPLPLLPLPKASPDPSSECLADDDLPLASLVSPVSLQTASPGVESPLEGVFAAMCDASRLSTILESNPDDSNASGARYDPPLPVYEMTLDKLESDMRNSMLFDEQPLFYNAKARYAAQRSSVYQGPDSYFGGADLGAGTLGGVFQMVDEHNAQGGARPQSPADGIAAGDAVDVDTVLQRAGQRNRQRLIAQNNRRSLYIAGSAAGGASDIRQEDVDANMRVLTEREMEELLKKMDRYNRVLLHEQQRWRSQHTGGPGAGPVEAWSLDQILEEANDQMLRSEQDSLVAVQPTEAGVPDGIPQSVATAATATSDGETASPAKPAAPAEPTPEPEALAPGSAPCSNSTAAPSTVAAAALAVAPASGASATGTASVGKKTAGAVGAEFRKPPEMGRTRSDSATRALAGSLASQRACLKTKKSSPLLQTRASAQPVPPASPPPARSNAAKSVKNLVAMFDKS
ncbi:Ark- serine/threonine protein kinase [Coemansia helicoidea]|uniref:Ark- serine/threonine protein kinase n=1 Tax=Coemansia helicoidea TaxID=1286919 RepID=A0ACC1LBN4_9FUNG|nr:Ark- serine/threonine protein kinase [Coemansia helicoidea]